MSEIYKICENCKYICQCAGGCRAAAVDEEGNSEWSGKDQTTCAFYKNGIWKRMEQACLATGFARM